MREPARKEGERRVWITWEKTRWKEEEGKGVRVRVRQTG